MRGVASWLALVANGRNKMLCLTSLCALLSAPRDVHAQTGEPSSDASSEDYDSIAEMERVYDQYAGSTGLEVKADGWKLLKSGAK